MIRCECDQYNSKNNNVVHLFVNIHLKKNIFVVKYDGCKLYTIEQKQNDFIFSNFLTDTCVHKNSYL